MQQEDLGFTKRYDPPSGNWQGIDDFLEDLDQSDCGGLTLTRAILEV